jgi:hypothetical protein
MDGSNYWCEFEKTSVPAEVDRNEGNDYAPIILVDQ